MLHRDVSSGAVQGIIDHNTASSGSEAAGSLVGAMASVSMDDLSKIDNDAKVEQELLKSDDENADQMDVDSQSIKNDALDAELEKEVGAEAEDSAKAENGEQADQVPPVNGETNTPAVKVEVDPPPDTQSAVSSSKEKGFQIDADSSKPSGGGSDGGSSSGATTTAPSNAAVTQEGFQNDAQKDDTVATGSVDSDGDIVMAPTVFGSFTMADLTIQNPTDSESILIDSFQGSIKLLLEILGTHRKNLNSITHINESSKT